MATFNENQERFRSLLNSEDGAQIREGLESSSVSKLDAEERVRTMDKAFSNLDEVVEDRIYANTTGGAPGAHSTGVFGTEFFDATVASMVKSFAGIFSIERAMEQPNAALPYMNLYGVKTGNLIAPNLGSFTEFAEADGYVEETVAVSAGLTPEINIDFSNNVSGILPGSIRIVVPEIAGATQSSGFVITDDSSANLLAPIGALDSAEVVYGIESGVDPVLTLTIGGTTTEDAEVKVTYVLDTPQVIEDRIKPELEYYNASTAPVIVPYEINQVANLAAKKALKIDMRQLTLTQITDEYTKLINKKVVMQVKASAKAIDEVALDLSVFSVNSSDYRTYLETFMAQLKEIDTAMARKTSKGVKITAYLVDPELGNLFSQLEMVTTKWVPNKNISFIDDIIGYWDGVPVVRHGLVGSNDRSVASEGVFQGYAIHKTKEGQLAPLMRGIFLPLTSMTEVGSFDNPLLKSGGIFSYEGVNALTQDLTIGFQVTPGTGTSINATTLGKH